MQIAIIGIYLAAMILLGLALQSRIDNISDFLIAGRNLGLLLTTATFAGTQLGAGVILGGGPNWQHNTVSGPACGRELA